MPRNGCPARSPAGPIDKLPAGVVPVFVRNPTMRTIAKRAFRKIRKVASDFPSRKRFNFF